MFFRNKVGMAYELDESLLNGNYTLSLYAVCLSDGEYEYKLEAKLSSPSVKPFYKIIEDVNAKPLEHYKGQDFGRKLIKTRN